MTKKVFNFLYSVIRKNISAKVSYNKPVGRMSLNPGADNTNVSLENAY